MFLRTIFIYVYFSVCNVLCSQKGEPDTLELRLLWFCGYWELKFSLLEEQEVLLTLTLTSEPPLPHSSLCLFISEIANAFTQ